MQRERVVDAVTVLRRVGREAQQSRITFLAAAVAYYGFVSVVPLLLLAVAVGTALAGPDLTEVALTTVGGFLSRSGEALVRDALTDTAGRVPATAVGVLLLAWSGSRLFRGLDAAFSSVYGVTDVESLPRQLADAAVVLAAVALAVAAAASIGVLVPVVQNLPFAGVVSAVGLLVVLVGAFYPVYYVFPDVDLDPREAVPGAAFAAVGWTALAEFFRLYTASVGGFRLYGVLGAAVLLVTFLYLGATIIMVGAVLNAVLAGRTDDEQDPREAVDRPEAAPDLADLAHEVRALRYEVDAKTVSRGDVEADLKQYVRRRLRRGQARGWGPYLVLLYGTVMTVGAFAFLDGGWAIAAMVVVWLSTLGLYALMLLVGVGLDALSVPGRVAAWTKRFRS